VEITTCHHQPHRAANYSFEASILQLADALANTMQLGSNGEKPFSANKDEELWEGMRVSEQISLFDFKEKISATYDETVSLFLQAS